MIEYDLSNEPNKYLERAKYFPIEAFIKLSVLHSAGVLHSANASNFRSIEAPISFSMSKTEGISFKMSEPPFRITVPFVIA